MAAPPFTILPGRIPTFEIYTDAGLSGWGAIAFGHVDNRILIAAKEWSLKMKNKHINVLELAALKFAFEQLDIQNATVNVHVDNTSCAARVRKGYCRAWEANNICEELRALVKQKGITVNNVSYVKSADNPADYWSRIFSSPTSSRELDREQ